MNEYKADKIRNVVLVGHSSSGKTSLAEAFLFNTGAVNAARQSGRPHQRLRFRPRRTTPQNFDQHLAHPLRMERLQDQRARHARLYRFCRRSQSRVARRRSAIVVVDAVSGVEVGTELVWQYCDELKMPRIIFINKLDRENADFDNVLAQLRERFGKSVVSLQIPIGKEANFKGEVNVASQKAFLGHDSKDSPVPADMTAQLAKNAPS